MGCVQERSILCGHQTPIYSTQVSDNVIHDEINTLLATSGAANTNQTYKVGLEAFFHFRNVQGLQLTWPLPNTYINKFIAYLSLKGYKHSTASAYLAAISFQCKLYCHVNPTKHFMVHKLLQGIKRSNKHTDTSLPITIDIRNSIIPK